MSQPTPSTSCPLPEETSEPHEELQSSTITSSKEIDSDSSSDGETYEAGSFKNQYYGHF